MISHRIIPSLITLVFLVGSIACGRQEISYEGDPVPSVPSEHKDEQLTSPESSKQVDVAPTPSLSSEPEEIKTTPAPSSVRVDPAVEFKRFNIVVTSGPQSFQDTLPTVFNDANWGIAQTSCKGSGYDLTPYLGREVKLQKYNTNQVYNKVDPLDVWVVEADEKIICVYKSVTAESEMAPGFFSAQDMRRVEVKE